MRTQVAAWLTRILLTFAVFTLGFGVGKQVGLRQAEQKQLTSPPETQAPTGPTKVVVTYMHTTFRCATCNTIEALAKETVETAFNGELAKGLVEWHEVDFQENEATARHYGIVASCVVVASVRNGKEVAFQRLDDVWTLYTKPGEFHAYVRGAIEKGLTEVSQAAPPVPTTSAMPQG